MPRKRSSHPQDDDFRGDMLEGKEVETEAYVSTKGAQTAKLTERKGAKEMSMIDPTDFNLDDSQEPYALPEGTEAKLRVIDVSKGTDKNGIVFYQPRFEVLEHPFSKDFAHYTPVPTQGKMDAKRLNNARHNWKMFSAAFGVDNSTPYDPLEEWPGKEGWAILGLRRSEDYGEQNTIRRFLAPQD